MRRTIITDSVKTNPKPSNRFKYLLGKLMPSIFGSPMHMQAILRDQFGNIKEVRNVYNTVTSAAKIRTADWLQTTPATSEKPSHMAVGTGTPSATALGVENDRNALTSSTTSGTAVLTMVGDWAAGDATAAITEAGVFDTAAGATMWLSASFAVINKGSLDTLQINWTFTIAQYQYIILQEIE